MKKLIYILILTLGIISCSTDDENRVAEYEFIKEYSAVVNFGGAVGLFERNFEVGEMYKGTNLGNGRVSIRIAEHSELNDDCPNSSCYQELLVVPQEFLKLVE